MTPARTSAGPGSARCFLALLPDAACREGLRRCHETHAAHPPAGTARGVRWVGAGSLHVTLRFLGETSSAQVEHLERELPALAAPLPALAARRFAVWPNRARPRLLVLEIENAHALSDLAHACELEARAAGFAAETRGFRAHVTLARLRPGCALELPPAPPTPLTFDSLALMASDLRPTGARYRALASAKLRAALRMPIPRP